jgi:hypothetical protein
LLLHMFREHSSSEIAFLKSDSEAVFADMKFLCHNHFPFHHPWGYRQFCKTELWYDCWKIIMRPKKLLCRYVRGLS